MVVALIEWTLMVSWFKTRKRPIHPQSAFLYWKSEHKDRLTQESRQAGIKFSKHAGAEWSKLEDKTKWESLAEADKQDYAYEMEEQRESHVRFASWP